MILICMIIFLRKKRYNLVLTVKVSLSLFFRLLNILWWVIKLHAWIASNFCLFLKLIWLSFINELTLIILFQNTILENLKFYDEILRLFSFRKLIIEVNRKLLLITIFLHYISIIDIFGKIEKSWTWKIFSIKNIAISI